MLGDLFFLHLKSEKSADFEHKRGVPGKGKTENFCCSHGFSVLKILQTENLKRKNTRIFRVFLIHKSLNINELKQNGGGTRDRTGDTRIFSPLLYRLSYPTTRYYRSGFSTLTGCIMLYNMPHFFILSSSFLKIFRIFAFFCAFLLKTTPSCLYFPQLPRIKKRRSS